MSKVCYVINFWLGDRRVKDFDHPLDFVKTQVEYLEKYKHNLDKIVFSFNVEPSHYSLLSEALKIIPKYIEVNIRENIGISYGAWSDAYMRDRTKYDYYIFNEDDYFFAQDNWDSYLVNKFNSLNNCGYLCGGVRLAYHSSRKKWLPHAAMSVGISSSEVLEKVVEKHGFLPHFNTKIGYKGISEEAKFYIPQQDEGQIYQSGIIWELGYNICDWRGDYRTLFRHTGDIQDSQIYEFYMWNGEDLCVPYFIHKNGYHYRSWKILDKDFQIQTADEYSEYIRGTQAYWMEHSPNGYD